MATARAQPAFDRLRARFKGDANAMTAVDAYQAQFSQGLRKP